MAEGDQHHEEIEQLKEVEHKESLLEKISEKLHGHDSSSDLDKDKKADSVKSKIFGLFGREKPVHKVFGGGKPADIFLWRNKKVSGGVLGGVTAVYVLFELLEYHLLTLICHSLILGLAVLFLWSNVSSFINKSPPSIPKVHISEDTVKEFASAIRYEINHSLSILRDIASGKDLKRFLIVCGLILFQISYGILFGYLGVPFKRQFIIFFLPSISQFFLGCIIVAAVPAYTDFPMIAYYLPGFITTVRLRYIHWIPCCNFNQVIAGLWILSILGSYCNFLTLFYISFVLLFTVPVLYEKYDDKVDAFAEKAFHEIKKQYAVFDAKVLSKIPKGPMKGKKKA